METTSPEEHLPVPLLTNASQLYKVKVRIVCMIALLAHGRSGSQGISKVAAVHNSPRLLLYKAIGLLY